MNENLKNPQPWSFIIDLDERGVFRYHVEDENGKIVFQTDNDDSESGEIYLTEDGFMRHIKEYQGSL